MGQIQRNTFFNSSLWLIFIMNIHLRSILTSYLAYLAQYPWSGKREMIEKLEHENEVVAQQIFTVFQQAYKMEAKLIGVVDFPPLLRSAKDIEHANTLFYGLSDNGNLAAVIEIGIDIIKRKNKQLDIHSLTVAPQYVRRGLADQLIRYVLAQMDCLTAIVETAVANIPAINLYKKHGFVEYKRWIPSHGIPKLALSVECAV